MQDERMLEDLKAVIQNGWHGPVILEAGGVTRYSQLYVLLNDEKADEKSRSDACYALFHLHKKVDKRKAVPALLKALGSATEIRNMALRALGKMGTARATEAVFKVATDQRQESHTRVMAWNNLWGGNAKLTSTQIEGLVALMLDPNEDALVRGQAIECSTCYQIPNSVELYTQLLEDPSADVRFGAAYGLSQSRKDITEALSALDKVVAYDQGVPSSGSWHVNREALLPFETIYYGMVDPALCEIGEDCGCASHPYTVLISPAPEYITFEWRYSEWQPSGIYIRKPTPEIKLRIDPQWLAKQIWMWWSKTKFNVRQPRPEAYLLDWHWQGDGQHLIGGLHRDGYGVVLSSNDYEIVQTFAAWYRGLFPAEQHLYLYEWAGLHVELKVGMDEQAIEAALATRSGTVWARDIASEELVFG